MQFRGLNLNHLVTLEHLLVERNLTRTAESHHLSQPAVSNMLAKLRDYFGDELLVRHGRDMERTPFGETLLPALRDALLHLQGVARSKPGFDAASARRSFRLVTSDYSAQILLPGFIREVTRVAPGVTICHVPMDLDVIEQFQKGDVDAVVTPGGITFDRTYPHRNLYTEEWVCIARPHHPLSGRSLTVDDYFRAPHVNPAYKRYWLANRWHPSPDVEVRAAVQLPFSAIPSLVAQTDYLAVLPRRLVQSYEGSAPFAHIPLVPPPPIMKIVVHWHPELAQDPFYVWMLDQLVAAAALLESGSPNSSDASHNGV
jgi:LysR family transcriptional regulator, nod-box dependent transcriptional activator